MLIGSVFVFSLLFNIGQVLDHLCYLTKLLLLLLCPVFVLIIRVVGNPENIVIVFNDMTTLGIKFS